MSDDWKWDINVSLDCGSYSMKAGFAGEDAPRTVLPSSEWLA